MNYGVLRRARPFPRTGCVLNRMSILTRPGGGEQVVVFGPAKGCTARLRAVSGRGPISGREPSLGSTVGMCALIQSSKRSDVVIEGHGQDVRGLTPCVSPARREAPCQVKRSLGRAVRERFQNSESDALRQRWPKTKCG